MPRILAILYIAFLAFFAFDVFVPGNPWWYILGAFMIHLLPNYILLVALVVAWKYELYGGVIFLLLGVGMTFFFQTYRQPVVFLLVSLPIYLIGILFLYHFFIHKAMKGGKYYAIFGRRDRV